MENVEIENVTLEDIAALQQICRQTFSETFSTSNDKENMTRYLEDSFSTSKLAIEVKDPDSRFYFAVFEGKVIGYLKVNTGKSQTEPQDEKALEVERIYTLAEYHGKKVGQLLFDKALQIAKELEATYLWLGVWEKNLRAISFYKKNGFAEFGKHTFKLGNDEQTDIMMKKKLCTSG